LPDSLGSISQLENGSVRREGENLNSILDAVRDASVLVRDQAAACESAGRLTDEVVAAIRGAGVFRMAMSRALGGPELSPLEQIVVLEELSAADGSAGWCGMINSDGGYVTSFLDPAVAKELYPSLDLATSVIGNPSGQARIDGDGYVVSGRWAFASGSTHCDWFFLNCMVTEGDTQLQGTGGAPAMRVAAIPAAHVEVLDTWLTTGLNATASNDLQVADVHVPAERTFSLLDDDPRDSAPLYQWRWMFFSNIAAVPLGVARAAIEEAKAVASTKLIMPSLTYARDDVTVQDAIGRAESLVAASRAYFFDSLGNIWETLQSGRPLSTGEWSTFRLATTYTFQSCKDAVGLVYETLGTTGIYRRSPLDRHLRDITTMAQHMLCQTRTYAACGRTLLGLDPGLIGF
jgi:alkylation response protein AidB-like acyl-CoA dehydrogenase